MSPGPQPSRRGSNVPLHEDTSPGPQLSRRVATSNVPLVHRFQDELLLVMFPFMKIQALVHRFQDELLLVMFPFMKIQALVHRFQDELLLVKVIMDFLICLLNSTSI